MKQQLPTEKVGVAIIILVLIATMHILRIGSYLQGSLYTLYYSFFSDIALPFGAYFLLCINERSFPFLGGWLAKASITFGAAAFAETMQAFGIPILGTTFDPLDYMMYALGTLAAALMDKQVFERFLPFWNPVSTGSSTTPTTP
jgi:hypothetical protein